MSRIIDGKAISAAVKARIQGEVSALNTRGISVGLAVIIVGENPASKIYVANKKKACEALGIISEEYALPESTTEQELLELINTLNNKKSIAPEKDVDAFNPYSVGRIMIGDYDFVPCTPAGIMEMLKYEGIEIAGKSCVVIGRSNIVGKPMAMLLLHANGTVTVCHSKTKNLKEICRNADILVAAVGKAKFVTEDMVKPGAVVIDVGMNRENGKLCGDVDFDAVKEKASAITPVPGGVGPMTIAMLMQNTLTAAKRQNNA